LAADAGHASILKGVQHFIREVERRIQEVQSGKVLR
jgi:hypothetical protein